MIEQRNPQRLLNLRNPARDGGDIDAEPLGGSGAIATVAQRFDDPQVVPRQLADSFTDIPLRAIGICRDGLGTSR
ncbi:hypothetical protein D3C76_1246960 [compost metagenome]